MFLKLRPENKKKKKKKKYINIYIQAQVIQNCTTPSRIDITVWIENNRI